MIYFTNMPLTPQKREELFKFLEKEETICGVPYNVIANYIDQLLIEKQERIDKLNSDRFTGEYGEFARGGYNLAKIDAINILKE